jgi:hypothetical protein
LIEGHAVRVIKGEMLPKPARLFAIEDGVWKILLGQQSSGGKPKQKAARENREKKDPCSPVVRASHRPPAPASPFD